MRFQVVLTSLALAAIASAQSSGPGTTPIPITGPNMTPPPSTGIETPTATIETQSPRPAFSTTSAGSAAPTETFPSITDASTTPTRTATNPLSSIIGSISSAVGSVSNIPSSILSSASSVAASATGSPNAGTAVQVGVAGWSVAAVAAGVLAGAAFV
ncbi:hypothetical protein FRC07_014940 [Ceratobasidium sp. 392]|nr:hypothetical protein FRC07_014940 [Ceratobasidium sp. 392]